eukprot:8401636-Lingulodinium_polyedra.AAC.1
MGSANTETVASSPASKGPRQSLRIRMRPRTTKRATARTTAYASISRKGVVHEVISASGST